MKTQINGVEITPKIAQVLNEWYEPVCGEIKPQIYVQFLNDLQDTLVRYLVDPSPLPGNELKDHICGLFLVKDDLMRFIPEKEASHDAP